MLLNCTKRLFARATVIPVVFGTAVSASPLPTPQTQETTTPDAANNQGIADQGDTTNNGNDLTRPQNSFETRLNDQTSASPTSQTNRDTLILRLNSKVTFDDGWKLAMLAQVPVVTESTVTFDPSGSDQDFGLGNAVFQTILAHAIDERWAWASAQGLPRGRRAKIWATGNGKSCRGSACAI